MRASRVVAILHSLSPTGAPRLTLDILEAIRQEAELRVVAEEGGTLLDGARRLGPSLVLRQAGFARVLPRRLATDRVVVVLAGGASRVRAAREAVQLRRWKPELVYVSSVAALPVVRMLRLSGIPIVLHVHEIGSTLAWYEQKRPGLILSIPDRYIAVSEAVARDLVDRLGVPSASISVVPPYVLSPGPDTPLPSMAVDRTPVIVGGAGNPTWTKGVDLWLLAARQAVDRLGADKLRFVWVGARDNQDGLQFRSMISRLGLESVVEVVPETDRPDDQFARFDVFAMSSWEESASLVVLDAMAMGVPVICFAPTGGPAEEVGQAGVVIPTMSPKLMGDAIVDLAGSPQKRRAIGVACADRARALYGRDTSLAALKKVLDSAVAR